MTAAQEEFLDALHGQRDAVGCRAAERIASQIPDYRSLDARAMSRLSVVITTLFDLLIARWRLADQPDADASVLPDHVMEAVQTLPIGTAIPLEDRLAAIRISTEVVLESIYEVAATIPDLDARFVLWAISVGYELVNTQTDALAANAARRSGRDDTERRGQLEQSLVEALLRHPADLDLAGRTAMELAVPRTRRWQAVVTRAPLSQEATAAVHTSLRRWARRTDRGLIAATIGRETCVLITGRPVEPGELDDVVTQPTGIGRPDRTLDELPKSLDRTRDAAMIAEQQGDLVATVAGTRLERFLAGRVQPDELIEDLLAPMLALPLEQAEMVAESLQAYLDANCSVTAAARQLHLHPQSFRYRLTKLEALFGAELHDPSGRMLLQIAITGHNRDDATTINKALALATR